jgi:hypothetical protein
VLRIPSDPETDYAQRIVSGYEVALSRDRNCARSLLDRFDTSSVNSVEAPFALQENVGRLTMDIEDLTMDVLSLMRSGR